MGKPVSFLVTTAVAALLVSQPATASAQAGQPTPGQPPADQPPPPPLPGRSPTTDGQNENIIVTGSRLRSTTIISPAPVQVIDQEAIQREGFINVQDALQLNPAFGNPGNARTTSNGSRTGVGESRVGLRNAGPSGTLVLVDGRRTVSADLGFIPSGFVDRVEVLTGGASSIYGSDALAGVVNFIFKRNFDGLQGSVQGGVTERGDNAEYQADFTVGRNFADGKGNALFFLGWSEQEGLLNAERPAFAAGLSSLGNTQRTGQPNDSNLIAAQNLFVGVPIYSQATNAGLFNVGGRNLTIGENGVPRPQVEADRFNGAPFAALAVPLERINAASRINYQVTPSINLFVQGTYSRTESNSASTSLVTASNGGRGVFGNSGVYNIESFVTSAAGVATRVRNPFVPGAIFDAARDTNGDGLRDIGFQRRQNEWGDFVTGYRRQAYQYTVGAEGGLGDFRYEMWYSYGNVQQNGTTSGLINTARVAQALEVIPGANGAPICASALARANGCAPLNIFGGPGSPSEAAVNWTRATSTRDAENSLQDISANIDGPLFQILPAGPVQIALGVQYRRERSAEIYDTLTNTNGNGWQDQPNVIGAVSAKEAYGEIEFPLLADQPFFYNLTVRGAARASKYSQLTKTFIGYNGSAEWAPIRDIRFRGTYARAIRAPGISDLFRPGLTSVDTVADPCLGVTLTSDNAVSANCRRDPLVVANITANGGVFTLNPQDRGPSVTTFTRQNPDLEEQYATTYTIGAVINPVSIDALRTLVLTADYYRLRITNGFGGQNGTSAANLCYVQGFDEWCQFTRRAAPQGPFSLGSIETYEGRLANSTGDRIVEGIDFTAAYSTELENLGIDGRLSFSATWSHLIASSTTSIRGAIPRDLKGELGTPSDPASGTISYDNDRFGFSITGQYLSEYVVEQPQRQQYLLANGQEAPRELFTIPHYFYTNAQMRYKIADGFQLFFGVRNLTDTDPRVIYSGISGNGYVYDPFGRRYYGGVRVAL